MIDAERFREGDHEYFDRLIGEYAPLVEDVVRGFAGSRDEADDLFQEVWIRVWRRRSTYQGGLFRTWLLVVARNHCRDRVRRRSGYRRLLEKLHLVEPLERPPGPLQGAIDAERRARVRALVETLPDRQREAILRRLDGGLTSAEIAEEMGVAPATVRSLISKGLSSIHEELETIHELS